jgi:predicted ATPase/transcriptional regulator with XRE-family HTH domain
MKRSDPPAYFGEWVKQRRKMLDLTQDELAEKSGCSVFALRKIESGERRPSKQLAELLALSLDIASEDRLIFIKVARGELNIERLRSPSPGLPAVSFLAIQPASPPSNIPLQPTPLIGREAELTILQKFFRDPQCRLLTLTGVGGIGKTRLAIEFASGERSSFPGGVFYIPLTPINSPEKIVSTIAVVIGFVFSGPLHPKEQLFNYLASTITKEALFILDNLEHLLVQKTTQNDISGVVELVTEILRRIPNIKILGTSRERLNLHGEWTFELFGLTVPPINYVGRLEEFSSIALFMKCAQRIKTDFHVTAGDWESIVHICQLVEGVPLAIELAAAWVRMLSCQEIAREIQSSLDFLATSMRDIPERHRSIRATFDHSWNLLSDEEQQALCRLSVFRGGFDRQAAEHVAGASLLLLASLVAKSLVYRTDSGYYDLHQVIRQYSLSHLNDHPCKIETYDCHCEYYLNFLHDREISLKNTAQQDAIRQLAGAIVNIRAAWSWAIGREKFDHLQQAGRAFGWYFEITGLYQEGIEQLELVVQLIKNEPAYNPWQKVLGLMLIHQGLLYFRIGDFAQARKHYEESLVILRSVGEQAWLADGLIFLGTILHLQGEYERARLLLEEGLVSARAGDDHWFEAFAIYNLGFITSLMGGYSEGYEQMLTGLSKWRQLGDPHAISMGLNFFVPTLIKLGRYKEANTFMLESIALCEQSRNRWGMGTAYRFLGLSQMAEGHILEARANLEKSLEIFGGDIVGWDIARTLSYLGEAAMLAGDLSEAKKIYLNALHLSIEAKAIPIALDSLLGLAQLFINTDQTDKGISLINYVLKNSFSPRETKDRASHLLLGSTHLLENEEAVSSVQGFDDPSLERILEHLLSAVPD